MASYFIAQPTIALSTGQVANISYYEANYAVVENVFNGATYASDCAVRITSRGDVVSAFGTAINLWGDSVSGGGHTLDIGPDAFVTSLSDVAAIKMFAPERFRNFGEVSGGDGFWGERLSGVAVENHGGIFGDAYGVLLIDSPFAYILNTGTISGGIPIQISNSGVEIVNTGLISATAPGPGATINVASAIGAETRLTNSGTIAGLPYAYSGSFQADTIINTGTIFGRVSLGEGNNLFDSREGLVTGAVTALLGSDTILGGRDANVLAGGGGNDVIEGHGGDDILSGQGDSDSIDGGDGQDWVNGGAGADLLIGGAGIDVLDYAGAAAAVTVNLETGHAAGGDAEGDQFSGFEWLRGGNGADVMNGNSAENRMLGGIGNDSLRGGSGNDRMLGEAGADTLTGDAGADILNGGLGADRFRYLAIGDSTTLVSGRDAIFGFSKAEGDRIDVSVIDANGAAAGDAAFTFIAGSFTGVAGQLRAFQSGGNTFVEGDTDGVNGANFQIKVMGLVTFAAGDFFL